MPTRAIAVLLAVIAPFVKADESPLRYLPSDTKVVLSIQFTALDPRDRAEAGRLFDDLFRAHVAGELGDDAKFPLTELRRVVLALPYAGSLNGVFVVQGKLDRKKLDGQMARVGKAGDLTVERVGKPAIEVYSRRANEKALLAMVPPLEKVPPNFRKLVAPQEVHLAAVDDQTLFVSLSGKRQIERAVRARGSAGLRVIPELAAVLKKQRDDDLASLIVMEDSLHPGLALVADEAVRETFTQFDHVTLRVVPGKEVHFEVAVQGKSSDFAPTLEAKAKRVLEVLDKLLPTLFPDKSKRDVVGDLLKSFRISRKDERVLLSGKVSNEDWRKLLAPKP